jgi:REP element-mobilizing transposase RayT
MAQPPHFEIENAAYFITTSTLARKQIFRQLRLAEIIIDILLSNRMTWEYTLFACVIMPDHLHVLLQPNGNSGISKVLNEIKGVSSRKINLKLKQGRIWQKGFYDFTIFSDRKFKEKFNYIHFNPVKWNLVKNAEDYPFSSARDYLEKYGAVYYDTS